MESVQQTKPRQHIYAFVKKATSEMARIVKRSTNAHTEVRMPAMKTHFVQIPRAHTNVAANRVLQETEKIAQMLTNAIWMFLAAAQMQIARILRAHTVANALMVTMEMGRSVMISTNVIFRV